MAAPVKVYGPPLSTAVSRVLVCLLEKDVPFHLLPVNMAKGEHKKIDYLKIQVHLFCFLVFANASFLTDLCLFFFICGQPFGQVPAFQDESITLFGKIISPSSSYFITFFFFFCCAHIVFLLKICAFHSQLVATFG